MSYHELVAGQEPWIPRTVFDAIAIDSVVTGEPCRIEQDRRGRLFVRRRPPVEQIPRTGHEWLPPGFKVETIHVSPDQLRAVAAILYDKRDDIASRRRWGRRQRRRAVITAVGYLNALADDREAMSR